MSLASMAVHPPSSENSRSLGRPSPAPRHEPASSSSSVATSGASVSTSSAARPSSWASADMISTSSSETPSASATRGSAWSGTPACPRSHSRQSLLLTPAASARSSEERYPACRRALCSSVTPIMPSPGPSPSRRPCSPARSCRPRAARRCACRRPPCGRRATSATSSSRLSRAPRRAGRS